jgi:hypothetical protein
MRKVEGKGVTHWYSYGIYEVYTDPKGWTTYEQFPKGDTLEELKSDYGHMGEAFKLPVLDWRTGKEIKCPKKSKKK